MKHLIRIFALTALFTRVAIGNRFEKQSPSRLLETSQENKKQKVVLLVGPHKTSSSSIQTNIMRWINAEDQRILPNWTWPSPIKEHKKICGDVKQTPKEFYPYIAAMYGSTNYFLIKCYEKKKLTIKHFINDYEKAFKAAWSEGFDLVIASEAMSFVSTYNWLLGDILNGMPWNSHVSNDQLEGSNDDITVVVNFRAPRIEHLISLWHQCCMEKMTLFEYLSTYLATKNDPLGSLDSLGLAQVFLEQGLNVILIDLSGVHSHGYDISNVVACDVLGAACTPDKKITGEIASIENVKKHVEEMVCISDETLQLIELAVRNYDCKFVNIREHDKLTILYPDEILDIFNQCQYIKEEDRILERDELVEKMKNIVNRDNMNGHNSAGRFRKSRGRA